MAAPILVISGPSGAGKTTVGRRLATGFDLSAHIQIDAFMPFVASGWVEPWRSQAARQNHVLGAAVAAAAIQFAEGGYTVILDGHLFPDALQGLGRLCAQRGVPLHYALLRPTLATCLRRAENRPPSAPVGRREHAGLFDAKLLTDQYSRFGDLGEYESHVFDASGTPDEIATDLLSAFIAGKLAVPPNG